MNGSKRYYQEGTIGIEPFALSGGNEPILKSEHLKILISLVEEDNDATLFQLAQRLEAQTQLQVSSSTISRASAIIGLECQFLSKEVYENRRESQPVKSG